MPLKDEDNRIAYIVDMMSAQDNTTWTIASISIASQVLLIGFYFQKDYAAAARALIALVGALLSGMFLLLVNRSNAYMVFYMSLLRRTGREEFLRPSKPGLQRKRIADAFPRVSLDHPLLAHRLEAARPLKDAIARISQEHPRLARLVRGGSPLNDPGKTLSARAILFGLHIMLVVFWLSLFALQAGFGIAFA